MALLDPGGAAVLDPQVFRWWSRDPLNAHQEVTGAPTVKFADLAGRTAQAWA